MSMTADPILVAADGGGTGCRACAGTLSKGILAQASGGPGNVQSDFTGAVANLTATAREALSKAGLGKTQDSDITAHFGTAGAHTPVEMAAVQAALPYGRSSVSGDRETNVRGVLGDADGYVVALGTGTIIACQQELEMRTVGGWGFDVSDQASGAWLGHRMLQEIVLCEDGLRPHTSLSSQIFASLGGLVPIIEFSATATPGDYAPLARDVVQAAQNADALALELMQQGASYIDQGLRHLGFVEGDALALAGGLGPHYAPYLAKDLTGNMIPPRGSALDGAFAMAAQAAMAAR